MTETVISSATQEVVLGFDRSFVIIGERINPTGRKALAEEMNAGDLRRVEADGLAQVAAGSHVLDVNAGIPLADEPGILAASIRLLQSVTEVPLCIDSSVVEALEMGLAAYQGKALVNSVTGEERRLERVLPLVQRRGAAVVGLCLDDSGIPEEVGVRFEIAKKILHRAQDHGIRACDVVIDPIVMPAGAANGAGIQSLELIRRLRCELKVNTICGASNISFGLPNRRGLNAAFLSMAIGAGLTSAILNPLHGEMVQAARGGDVLMGRDGGCRKWIAAHRRPGAVRRGRACRARSEWHG